MTLPPSAPVYFAFGLWAVLCFAILARWRNARGVTAALIGAWLFLPQATVRFPYIFYTTKMIAVTLVLLVTVCVLDFRRVIRFRPHWMDVPMGLFCAVPFFSALANQFPLADALRLTLEQVCTWGIPYLLGRLYLTDWDALRDVAAAIVIGGCIYIPLCWYEILRGPYLHVQVYGFPPSPLEMAERYGGWRPIVFQLHGLMVGLFMASATVCAFWLWYTRAALRLWKIPMLWIFVFLVLTLVAVKSVNGWVLAILGILLLWGAARLAVAKILSAVYIVVTAYLGLRITGLWDAGELTLPRRLLENKPTLLSYRLLFDRATSIYYRVLFEQLITERARSHWILGWGTNDRAMVRDYLGRIQSVSDSYWIAVYGMWGIVGLVLWLAVFIVPILTFVRSIPSALWRRVDIAPAAALTVIVLMYQLDALLNTMHNPIYVFCLGGVVCGGLAAKHIPAAAPKTA